MAEENIEEKQQQQNQEAQEAAEEEVSEEELEAEEEAGVELPFPRATITNKLRKHLDKGKQIKGQVKVELNLWLGKMIERVAEKMNQYPYSYVDGSMFRESVESYENIQDIEKEKERIIKQLESIKAACDVLILEVDRKFVK